MKIHTNDFKTKIKEFGKEIDSKITYTIGNEEIELGVEDLNSISPHYEGSILKSVMRQLDIDSNVEIPEGTIINFQFGVLIDDDYEYLNFGNYIVYKVEKQEDTNSYKITCYDKMLYSMVDYELLGITYPITIRNYLSAICTKLGLTFKNINDTFANYDKQIPLELYLDTEGNSLGYTFRDVLDELAQVTASTICINEDDDELEIRYINDTGDTIDEEYLKDVNVNFGEQYGPINTIVFSRAGADKIYMSYPENLPENQRKAIEIADNQILNRNDRDTYLSDILNKLLGLQYYLNDFSSTGITYYDLCDRYNVSIGNETYSCVMFNDEIDITQGLEEQVHTDMPEETETDYTKADKTDRRINQTYFIVDKQNQTIESVVSQTSEQNTKISTLTQKVDQLESEISNVTGMVETKDSTLGTITFTDTTNESEPITIKVYPITNNISYLYPNSLLYPSSTTYLKIRTIRFHNNTTNEDIDYVMPDDLLYYNSENYDEFYLDLNSQTCQITKKCKFNADGTIGLLTNATVVTYDYPHIALTEGIYTVSLLTYNSGYILTTLMSKNIYTDQFYTKVETDSKISQKADEIELDVSQTLSNYSTTTEMNSAINIKANEISSVVSTKVGNDEIISKINQTAESITINANKLNLTGYITASDLSGSGTTTINGANITTGTISANRVSGGTLTGTTLSGNAIQGGSISITKSGYYFNMGLETNHPNCSGLNVGSGGIRINGLGFSSDGSVFNFSSQINVPILYATNFLTTNHIQANKAITIHAGGNDGSYANRGGFYLATGQMQEPRNNHITFNAQPGNGFVYAEGDGTPRGRVAIDSSGPSSRCLKKNIKEYTNNEFNEALDLLDQINIYNYEYKYKIHDKENQYGFIIDDLLDNKLADKFLCFKDETAGIMKDGRLDYSASKDDYSKFIKFKRYDEETLIKYLLVVCKALQNKIEKLEGEK